MAMKTIRTQKTGDGVYMFVLDESKTCIGVDVVQINEYPARRHPRYRVDFQGRTVKSLLTLTEAKKEATKLLKPYR